MNRPHVDKEERLARVCHFQSKECVRTSEAGKRYQSINQSAFIRTVLNHTQKALGAVSRKTDSNPPQREKLQERP